MTENDKIHIRYCRNCKSVQEMKYIGPLLSENDLEKVHELGDFKDIYLYFCKRCRSTLSYFEPKSREDK